jgi:hypothetical protein
VRVREYESIAYTQVGMVMVTNATSDFTHKRSQTVHCKHDLSKTKTRSDRMYDVQTRTGDPKYGRDESDDWVRIS